MNPEVLRFFHPLVPSQELRRRPLQARVAGRALALFRDASGRPAAVDDICPHRRAPLSQGRVRPDGRIACPYHGWNFDAEGRGRSPACPELINLRTRSYQVVERFDYLWVAERETPSSAFPALGWEEEGFRFAGVVSTLFEAPLDVTLDNITEDEHFAYVHSTFGWDEAGSSQVEIETAAFDDRSEVRLTGPQRRTPWAPLGGVRAGDQFHNRWLTRFDPVRTIYTFGWRNPATGRERPVTTRPAVFLVPETERTTRLHMFLFLRVAPSLYRTVRPFVHWMARAISLKEVRRDARFVAYLAAVPSTLRGMRLTRFDRALAHNRKLLETVYWATASAPASIRPGPMEVAE